jgi:hypothetical protein
MSDEAGKNFEPGATDAADRSKNDPPYESGKHLPTMPDPTQQDPQVGDPRPDDEDTEQVERRRAS